MDDSDSAAQRISAMSFVCALVTDGLQNENVINIQHFCGLHTDQDDPLRGPSGVLRALVAQLIRLQSLHVSFVNLEQFDELRQFDVRRLCDLFINLIRQLPADNVLFCIVDGISLLYDNDDWLKEARLVLQTFCNLTCDDDVHAVFKVMITNPLANTCLEMNIQSQDYLALRQDSRNTDGNPLTRRRMLAQSQRAPYEYGGRSFSGYSDRSSFAEDQDFDEGFVDGDDEEDIEGGDFYEGDLKDDDS